MIDKENLSHHLLEALNEVDKEALQEWVNSKIGIYASETKLYLKTSGIEIRLVASGVFDNSVDDEATIRGGDVSWEEMLRTLNSQGWIEGDNMPIIGAMKKLIADYEKHVGLTYEQWQQWPEEDRRKSHVCADADGDEPVCEEWSER